MEVNVQNDDEMILVVVEDDENSKKCLASKGSDRSDPMPVPISVKIEPIEDMKGLYCTEDVNDIFPIALTSRTTELVEVQPDIEVLDEEYLSQEDYLEEEYITDEIDEKKFETTERKRNPRKSRHKYLSDVAEFPQLITFPTKRKYVRKAPRKKAPVVSNNEDYFEIEFLEDDIISPKKEPMILHSGSEEEESKINEIEFLDSKQKGKRKKSAKKAKKTEPVSDEEFLEIEYLEEPVEKKHVTKMEEDDDYVPDVNEEDDDDEIIYDEEDEDFEPKGTRKKTSNSSNKPSSKEKPTRKPRRRKGQKAPEKPKAVRHIRSFIAEVRNKQPLFKENEQKLVEYLADFMRKRRPPAPLPNSYMLKDENEYSCSYCDVESATEAAAARHYQQSHGPRYLVCLACGDDFRCTANLYKHEKRCRAPDAMIQLQARGSFLGRKGRGRPFLTRNKYVPHERPAPAHPEERNKFYCPQCPAVYVRSSLLKEHMHKHTGFRPFQCSECPAAYVSQHQLNKHARKHSTDEFICDHCGKVFNMKNSLISHMDTHLPKEYVCDLCGKVFKRRLSLQSHMLSHEQTEQLDCNICGKVFKWKISLQSHMHTHEPRPRFGCGRCGRRYAQRSAVKVHIMRDHLHLPPPAACPVCPKRYNRMSHVKSHMKRDHGLILMTKNMLVRNLPYMKVEQLEGAKIVFSNEANKVVVKSNDEIPLLYTQ